MPVMSARFALALDIGDPISMAHPHRQAASRRAYGGGPGRSAVAGGAFGGLRSTDSLARRPLLVRSNQTRERFARGLADEQVLVLRGLHRIRNARAVGGDVLF